MQLESKNTFECSEGEGDVFLLLRHQSHNQTSSLKRGDRGKYMVDSLLVCGGKEKVLFHVYVVYVGRKKQKRTKCQEHFGRRHSM